MATTLSTFVDYVIPYVVNCPGLTINRAVQDAIIDFSERTWIRQIDFTWNITEDDVMEELNDAVDLDLDGVSGLRPIEVLSAQVDGYNLDLKERKAIEEFPEWWNDNDVNTSYWYLVDNDTIRLYPVPIQDFQLFLRAAFRPQRDSTSFDDDLYKDWADVIAEGAKFRLFTMPEKPWTNSDSALLAKTLYEKGVSRAKILVRRNYLPLKVFKKGWI